MMLPEKVNVCGIEYEVIEKDFIEINHNRNYQGACSYSDGTIEVLKELQETRKEQVFCHELVHAMFNEAGFDEQDEDTVNRLGIVLYQVLKENKLYFGNKIDWYEQGGEVPVKVDGKTIAKALQEELKLSSRTGGVI